MFADVYWFEAPDMWGKTTQINRISAALESRGHRVLIIRNPGGDGLCGNIRSILLDIDKNKNEQMSYMTRRALNQADYFQKLQIIQENINRYDYILCDRCTLISDMVYGFMLEEDKFIRSLKRDAFLSFLEINKSAIEIINNNMRNPEFLNVLFLGSISEHDMLERIKNVKRDDKETIYDKESIGFKMKIRDNYDKIVSTHLNIIKDEDTTAIKSALEAFDFVALSHSFKNGYDKITQNMLEIILAK